MHEKSTWEAFFDDHAPLYEQNVFTKNTIKEVDFLLDEIEIMVIAQKDGAPADAGDL